MAIVRLTNTYGVLEKNAVVYPRTGNIMAMFETEINAENGMLLDIDYKSKKIVLPGQGDVTALVDSCEKEYYNEHIGLNSYALGNTEFKPRMGILSVNDRFTTTTVSYDETEFADVEAISAAIEGGVYGSAHTDGTIIISATKPSADVILVAEEIGKMANGEYGIKFAVIKA